MARARTQGAGRERTTCARPLLLHRCRLPSSAALVLLVCSFRADLVPLCEAAAEETPALAMADEKPKVSSAPASAPRLAAGVAARAGVRPEPATGSPRLRAPHGAAAAQAPALRAIPPSSSSRPRGRRPRRPPRPRPPWSARRAQSWARRIADTRGPTGRERGFSGPVGRARVTRGVGARDVPTLGGPRAGAGVAASAVARSSLGPGLPPLGGGGRRTAGTPAPGRTGRL